MSASRSSQAPRNKYALPLAVREATASGYQLDESPLGRQLLRAANAIGMPTSLMQARAAPKGGLSDRQRRIVSLLSRGLDDDALVERACVCVATIRVDLRKAREQLRVRTTAQLVRGCVEFGLLVDVDPNEVPEPQPTNVPLLREFVVLSLGSRGYLQDEVADVLNYSTSAVRQWQAGALVSQGGATNLPHAVYTALTIPGPNGGMLLRHDAQLLGPGA